MSDPIEDVVYDALRDTQLNRTSNCLCGAYCRSYAKTVVAALREHGLLADQYEQIGWTKRHKYSQGQYRDVIEGGPDHSWSELDAARFTVPVFVRRETE